jgi:hypothetical protein
MQRVCLRQQLKAVSRTLHARAWMESRVGGWPPAASAGGKKMQPLGLEGTRSLVQPPAASAGHSWSQKGPLMGAAGVSSCSSCAREGTLAAAAACPTCITWSELLCMEAQHGPCMHAQLLPRMLTCCQAPHK